MSGEESIEDARLEMQRTLAHRADDAAHAFRNVLSAILLNARLARMDLPADARACAPLASIEAVVEIGKQIARELEVASRAAARPAPSVRAARPQHAQPGAVSPQP